MSQATTARHPTRHSNISAIGSSQELPRCWLHPGVDTTGFRVARVAEKSDCEVSAFDRQRSGTAHLADRVANIMCIIGLLINVPEFALLKSCVDVCV